ncbi:MAG: tRNA (N(6)-L-threonylcarbamoyladenosine(37)-C(2))-methylthiotransferase MtaB [Nitrospirae bacterium]|nr:tRNA (N(6)-L-threonylcarbamoyladenosine(37)-C(2))-methylthiotransferase MtaB [Nitrospirota bacterium]
MRFSVLTLGCKVNQSESLQIERQMLQNSHIAVNLDQSPDICIINTCTVTAKSDYQSRQLIRRAINTGAKVYVTGCYSELNQSNVKQLSNDVEVVSTKDKNLYFQKLAGINYSNIFNNSSRARELVKIQDGCNSACSYCTIPIARGHSVSRDRQEILSDIKALEQSGFNEAILTGIHIGAYLKDGFRLWQLVEYIIKNTQNIRLRLSSLEPEEIDEGMLSVIQSPRVCSHLHIPLQSGDDEILKAMNRTYITKQYHDTIIKIYNAVDNISIGTDIIVGFPGETEKLFNNTFNFIKGLPLTYLHVFPYSKRTNTKAANLPSQVESTLKKQRAKILSDYSKQIKSDYMESQVGKILTGIIEKFDGKSYFATSENYLKIIINQNGHKLVRKNLIKILINSSKNDYISGIPIKSS